MIWLARTRGLTPPYIARNFGLTDRQVRRVIAEYREKIPSVFARNAWELMDSTLESLDVTISDLAQIQMDTHSPAVKVRAIAKKVEVIDQKWRYLKGLGLVPRLDGPLVSPEAGRELAAAVRDVCARHSQVPGRGVGDLCSARR